MKTKLDFSNRLSEIKSELLKTSVSYEENRALWKLSSYKDTSSYDEMLKFERKYNQLKRESERLEILSKDSAIFANQHFYSDIKPWEVVEIKTDKCLIVRRMKCAITDKSAEKLQDSFVPGGFFGHFNNEVQEWQIESDPEGIVETVRLHKDGCYYIPGQKGAAFILSEEPVKFYDYNF